MRVKLLLSMWVLSSGFLLAQKSCDEALFVKDSLVITGEGNPSMWLKFKAKGSVLNINIVSAGNETPIPYTIYPLKDCNSISKGYVEPIRTVGTGLAVMTNEIWQLTLDEGICVCDHCLSKITLSPQKDLKLVQEKMYLVEIHAKGLKVKVKSEWSQVDKKKKVFDLTASRESLEVGMKLHLKEVQFVASKTAYLNQKTEVELDSLFQLLNTNKTLNVMIEGHVNGPTSFRSERFQQLSSDRAKKIKDYLIGRGINKSRVQSIGKSNREMKYPSPKTEWEAQQNRRVEVRITAV
jgi:outer membrane protein OmpA-like peptidoglycan-associated protein